MIVMNGNDWFECTKATPMYKTPVQDPYQAVVVKGVLGFRVLQGKQKYLQREPKVSYYSNGKSTTNHQTKRYTMALMPMASIFILNL